MDRGARGGGDRSGIEYRSSNLGDGFTVTLLFQVQGHGVWTAIDPGSRMRPVELIEPGIG